jgi:hypothetical protein
MTVKLEDLTGVKPIGPWAVGRNISKWLRSERNRGPARATSPTPQLHTPVCFMMEL